LLEYFFLWRVLGIVTTAYQIGNDNGIFRIVFRWAIVAIFLIAMCCNWIYEHNIVILLMKPIGKIKPIMSSRFQSENARMQAKLLLGLFNPGHQLLKAIKRVVKGKVIWR